MADVGIGDVFLVAGQSNAVGNGDNNQSYVHGSLKATMYRVGGTWAQLADPSGVSGGGSPWPLLATLYLAAEGVPIAFLTTAINGSGLSSDGDWKKGGTQYTNALATVTAAGVSAIKAILWHQGEAEVNAGTSQATYQTDLSQMLDDMQADNAALAGVKLVCAQIGMKTTGGSTRAEIDPIRLAQQNRWINDADILPGPCVHDVDLSDGDGVHFGSGADSELQTLANRWWRALLAAYYGGAEAARGPQFLSAARVGTTVTVTFTGGEGNLQNQDDETGFRFTDDGTPIAITGSVANGTDAVDLTLADTPTGGELISFGSGNDGAGATLSDSGTYPQPPEPFVDEAVS